MYNLYKNLYKNPDILKKKKNPDILISSMFPIYPYIPPAITGASGNNG